MEYSKYLKSTSTNDVTIHTKLRGIRAFCNFCMDRGYMNNFKITLPKKRRAIKETYTFQEISILLTKPNMKETTFSEYRTWVILNFVYGTGMRLNSLINIKVKDIDLNSKYVFISHLKSGRQKSFPIGQTLANIIKEYLTYRGGKSEDYLFPNQFGNQLTKGGFQSALIKYHKRRGISKTSIHLVRHLFARNYINNGGDKGRLQGLLDHSTSAMTDEYVEICGVDLKLAYEDLNPLEKYYKTIDKKDAINMKRKN